jgi:hypothetical protein
MHERPKRSEAQENSRKIQNPTNGKSQKTKPPAYRPEATTRWSKMEADLSSLRTL